MRIAYIAYPTSLTLRSANAIQREVLEHQENLRRLRDLGNGVGGVPDDERAGESSGHLPGRGSVNMRVVPECARRVAGRYGEGVFLRLSWRDPQHHIVGIARGWDVQAVEVKIRGLRQVVSERDPNLVSRLCLDRRPRDLTVVCVEMPEAATDLDPLLVGGDGNLDNPVALRSAQSGGRQDDGCAQSGRQKTSPARSTHSHLPF